LLQISVALQLWAQLFCKLVGRGGPLVEERATVLQRVIGAAREESIELMPLALEFGNEAIEDRRMLVTEVSPHCSVPEADCDREVAHCLGADISLESGGETSFAPASRLLPGNAVLQRLPARRNAIDACLPANEEEWKGVSVDGSWNLLALHARTAVEAMLLVHATVGLQELRGGRFFSVHCSRRRGAGAILDSGVDVLTLDSDPTSDNLSFYTQAKTGKSVYNNTTVSDNYGAPSEFASA
jgi:hypothetical protein